MSKNSLALTLVMAKDAIRLLNCMIESGEQHSEESKKSTLEILDKINKELDLFHKEID